MSIKDERQQSPKACKKESRSESRSRAARVQRQNELLDEGLCETFPASDPVSVARVE